MQTNGPAVPMFLQGTEPFENYVERLNLYFKVADTKESDKVAVLGITLPLETSAMLKTQISLKSLDEITFKDLIKVLAPKNIVIAEHFSYGNAGIKQLKLTNQTHRYGDFLDEALRDRLISGMLSEQMVRQLLAESEELKFAEAVKIVMDMDAVAKSATLMSGEVNVIAEPACFRQLAIEDVQYVGASKGHRQHPPQRGGFTHQPYKKIASQNGALT
ncbi:hypothetical protein PR048_004252 [Dryococelus australis]|uniref:Uncharacterized protein n=1 Tax=Dryococelus australis TaxID=614101 RepID=A0ABQ9I4Z7_9NEOP|nr:hypothetical protein PR048_004252 [Dryococelus australis]